MQLQVILHIFVIASAGIHVNSGRVSSYCGECEEEIWEEVPCDEILKSSTTTTTSTTTSTSPKPPPITTTTTKKPYISTQQLTTVAPIYSTSRAQNSSTTKSPTNGFKKCYCECKVGCKDFCRKVIINDTAKNEIMQISKTSLNVPNGLIEVKHLHQRKFVPTSFGSNYDSIAPKPLSYVVQGVATNQEGKPYASVYPSEDSVDLRNAYVKPDSKPSAATTNANGQNMANVYPDALVDSTGYSIDEITKILQSDIGTKTEYTNSLPVYYSSSDAARQYPAASVLAYTKIPARNTETITNNIKSSATPTILSTPSVTSSSSLSNTNSDKVNIYTSPGIVPYIQPTLLTSESTFEAPLNNYIRKYVLQSSKESGSYLNHQSSTYI